MMERRTAETPEEIEISSKMIASLIKVIYRERRRLSQYDNVSLD